MKTKISYLILLILIVACNNNQEIETSPDALYLQPQTVKLNKNEGYIINPTTGDSVQLLINHLGDTIQTGIPIPTKGKVINPDSVSQPKVIPLRAPNSVIRAHTRIHKIPNDLTVIPVNSDSLTIVPLTEITKNDTIHYLINSKGKRVKTGVKIPAKGKIVPTTRPQSTPALALGFKDNGINNMQYLDVDQGMPSSYIFSTLEDKRGNIWFGTNGNGVSRYDGKSFTHFTTKEGLSGNIVTSIIEDKNGNLWFSTYDGGVSKYDGESFTCFTTKEGLSSDVVYAILEDQSGNLWFGTNGGGVCRFDGESFTHFTTKEGLSNDVVRSIAEDKNGNLWFGTHGGGLSKYDGESFTHFTISDGLSNDYIYSILEDKSGNMWFGTWGGGVNKYDGESFTHFAKEEGLSNNKISSILEDQNGDLWFATYGDGINKYDKESFTHFTTEEGLSNDVVYSILEDQSGNLWFGTDGGGVSIYDRETFTHFTTTEGLSEDQVYSILEDKNGNLWFGTHGGGLSKYDGESFTYYTTAEGLSSDVVTSILEDQNGNLWFGTLGGGVNKYDGESFTHFTTAEGLSNNIVYCIVEDQNGNLWFGTRGGGVSKYDGDSFTHFTTAEGLSNDVVRSIAEDQNGNLWFGTNGGGVSKYNGESFTHFTTAEGLSNNKVLSIIEDQNGNLWFGTYGGGLSKYDGNTFTHFTTEEGLSNDIIYSIVEDRSGNLWISTENGLNEIVLESDTLETTENGKVNVLPYSINQYVKSDGLRSLDFYGNSVCLDSKNRIWWGGGKSLTMLDMNKHSLNNQPPTINMKELYINEFFIDYRNIVSNFDKEISFKGVQQFENYPLNLILKYNQNHLTFHFIGIDWAAQHKIHYSYKMEGLDSKWSSPSTGANADYRNLPYGTFTFKVRAIGESGEWSEPFEYQFTINPPWWYTWWAQTIYVILGLLIILLILRWRTAKLKKHQRELKKEVLKATIKIRKQKDEIEKEKDRSEELLLNILPEEIAEELKEKGTAETHLIEFVTVLFTDFKGFTALSEILSPQDLVKEINVCFSAFDYIMEKYNIEKIKTIGDAYMAAGGLPTVNETHAQDVIRAALDIQKFILDLAEKKKENNEPYFEIRIGVHTGPVVAGIVGVKKFQYDIWGDTVNTASRMESSGSVGKVNISESTYEIVKNNEEYAFESRGKIEAKGKGLLEMFFVERKKS